MEWSKNKTKIFNKFSDTNYISEGKLPILFQQTGPSSLMGTRACSLEQMEGLRKQNHNCSIVGIKEVSNHGCSARGGKVQCTPKPVTTWSGPKTRWEPHGGIKNKGKPHIVAKPYGSTRSGQKPKGNHREWSKPNGNHTEWSNQMETT